MRVPAARTARYGETSHFSNQIQSPILGGDSQREQGSQRPSRGSDSKLKNPNFIDASEAVGGLITVDQLKTQAKVLRSYFEEQGVSMSHSKCLEAISRASGFQDWNTASAWLKQHEEHLEREFGKLENGISSDRSLYATKERIVYCGWQKTGAAIEIPPNSRAEMLVIPQVSPWFEPKAVRLFGCYADDPSSQARYMVRDVRVGGSPQMPFIGSREDFSKFPNQELISDVFDRSGDPSLVNWSVFSTIGLARELIFNLFNIDKSRKVIASCAIWGNAVTSLEIYDGGPAGI